jgi:hypothetical protein
VEFAGGLSALQKLDLQDNEFSGTLPAGLVRTSLTTLNLASNQLSGGYSWPLSCPAA